MRNDIRIETERLILRVPTMNDAQEINAAMNEVWHELQLWMSWAYDGEETLEATQRYLASVATSVEEGNLPLTGYCKDTGLYVVSTGIMLRDGEGETGYWVAKNFLGKGYATEAAIATINYAFTTMELKKMHINYFEGNDKSRHIIEKLGFVKTETLPKNHVRCLDGVLLDEHRYEITEERWRQRCR